MFTKLAQVGWRETAPVEPMVQFSHHCLTKPFHIEEFIARIYAVTPRAAVTGIRQRPETAPLLPFREAAKS